MKSFFVISDNEGTVWGIAPSKLQARIQMQWHLPRGNNYNVEVFWLKD